MCCMCTYSFKSQWVYKFGLKLCVSYTTPSWHMGNIKGIDYTMSPYGYICAYYWGGLGKAHIHLARVHWRAIPTRPQHHQQYSVIRLCQLPNRMWGESGLGGGQNVIFVHIANFRNRNIFDAMQRYTTCGIESMAAYSCWLL